MDAAIRTFAKLMKLRQYPGASSRLSYRRLMKQSVPYLLKRDWAYPPLTIFLSINNKCNMKCLMCDVGQKNLSSSFAKHLIGPKEEMSLDLYRSIIDDVKSFSPKIAITSTEPLLHPNIIDMLVYAKKSNIEIEITTNGLLLSQYAEEFVKNKLDTITISIDGPEAVHDEIRGVRGGYQRAMDGLKIIHDVKKRLNVSLPMVMVSCTITNHNYKHIVPFVREMSQCHCDSVNITFMTFRTKGMVKKHKEGGWEEKYPSGETCVDAGTDAREIDVGFLFEQLKKVNSEGIEKLNVLPRITRKDLEIYFKEESKFVSSNRCKAPWFIAQIISDGTVIPLTRCYDLKLGNLKDKSFLDIWNDTQMRGFRRDLLKHKKFPACSKCDQVT